MVDGVLLLVDAAEGPRPQTRFVLKKALELGHRAIVVINKVDRKDADPTRVLNETFDLFIELGATDEQAEFPVVYAVATQHRAGLDAKIGSDLNPLFETIIKEIPAPVVEPDAPLQMLVTTLDYDTYRGLTAIGRVTQGKLKLGETVLRISADGKKHKEEIRYLYVMQGLERVEVDEVIAGEIAAVTGLEEVKIGETLADKDNPIALPTITVEEPTVRMTFGINTAPFAGKEGRWGTSRNLRDRLFRELKSNIALRVEETSSTDTFVVSGRGELHLGILIETMRREGYEFEVSRPEVIIKEDAEGNLIEPYEEVHIETNADTMGIVIEMLGKRRGDMVSMGEVSDRVTLTYRVPTRGLLGFRHQFLTATRGFGVMHTIFNGYSSFAGKLESRSRGSLIAWEPGPATTFGLLNAEERGILFIKPGVEVYAGMIVGEHQRPGDLEVNVAKEKQLNNMRSANREIDVRLSPPRDMSLDECIEYLAEDELLEVTPENLRLRKRLLDHNMRNREVKRKKEQLNA
jgi:GTP-binding protein